MERLMSVRDVMRTELLPLRAVSGLVICACLWICSQDPPGCGDIIVAPPQLRQRCCAAGHVLESSPPRWPFSSIRGRLACNLPDAVADGAALGLHAVNVAVAGILIGLCLIALVYRAPDASVVIEGERGKLAAGTISAVIAAGLIWCLYNIGLVMIFSSARRCLWSEVGPARQPDTRSCRCLLRSVRAGVGQPRATLLCSEFQRTRRGKSHL
jgi:hypothetical protein